MGKRSGQITPAYSKTAWATFGAGDGYRERLHLAFVSSDRSSGAKPGPETKT